jgi:glutamine synthetase
VHALGALATPDAKALFTKFGVLSERELEARVDIFWEKYVKVQNIEANCALDIAKTLIVPATALYLGQLASAGYSRGVKAVADRVVALADGLVDAIHALEHAQHSAHAATSVQSEARVFVDEVIPAQNELRQVADELETLVADDLWPLPKYRELLFQY